MTKDDIKKILPNIEVLESEPMAKHTTFKVGGPARLFVTVSEEGDIIRLVSALREAGEKFEVMGRGSNLLVSDEGYDGVIVCVKSKENGAKVLTSNNETSSLNADNLETKLGINSDTVKIYAPAGDSIIALSGMARDLELSGLEFACGIPGSIGGAVIMNAGAHGGQVSDIIESVRAIDASGNVKDYSNSEMNFRYRGSLAMDEGLVVLGVAFALKKGDKEEITQKMKENIMKRASSQPLEYPSAGSTFKRPENNFAGKLIEDAGLKGYKIGGAQVSEKHAGFVINVGGATASDIINLCDYISKTVQEKFGVSLEMEVRKIGF